MTKVQNVVRHVKSVINGFESKMKALEEKSKKEALDDLNETENKTANDNTPTINESDIEEFETSVESFTIAPASTKENEKEEVPTQGTEHGSLNIPEDKDSAADKTGKKDAVEPEGNDNASVESPLCQDITQSDTAIPSTKFLFTPQNIKGNSTPQSAKREDEENDTDEPSADELKATTFTPPAGFSGNGFDDDDDDDTVEEAEVSQDTVKATEAVTASLPPEVSEPQTTIVVLNEAEIQDRLVRYKAITERYGILAQTKVINNAIKQAFFGEKWQEVEKTLAAQNDVSNLLNLDLAQSAGNKKQSRK